VADILQTIKALEAESYGFATGDLADQRAEAIKRYLCEPYGNEVDGRSQVVSTDLRDVVEWIVPQWLRVTMSGDQVVKFAPDGPEDEKQAEQETAYVNHIILERNDALTILSTWARDALMSKNGYVKAWWEERADIKSETYKGITDDAFAALINDASVELVAHSEQQVPTAAGLMNLHDVRVKRVYPCGYVKIDNVPPEEILIHKATRGTNLQDSLFVQHRTHKTASEIRQMGYDIPDDLPSDEDSPDDVIPDARDRFSDDDTEIEAPKLFWLCESFLRHDSDEDGIAELRRVVHIGTTVLADEEADLIPIACITPIIFPHRHIGIGYDDLVAQHGLVKTSLMRQGLDNLYLANNVRIGADIDNVSLDDLLTSRAGGIIRTKGRPGDALMPIISPNTFPAALQGMEWVDSWRENSTGISAYYQGMNADSLNKTATGISQIMSASQQRVEAVIRSFANGFRDLCYIVHALTLKNATAPEKIKIQEDWVPIDPREWVKRTNLTVTVGLGTGSRESRIQQLMMLWQLQLQGLQAGIATPENLYQTGRKLAEEMGYRNSNQFWADPAKRPPQQPQPPPEIVKAQMQIQADQQKTQAQMQQEQQKAVADIQLEQAKIEQNAALERYKAELQAQTQLQIEQMRLGLQVDVKNAEFGHSREMKQMEIAAQPKEEDDSKEVLGQAMQLMAQAIDKIGKPKAVVRDDAGRVIGVKSVE
jgi:hypothetical protein